MASHVQVGCGFSAPESWVNFDASPRLRFERLPLIGRLEAKNIQRFPANVRFGNIIAGLPIKDKSVDAVFASHVLEHLTRVELPVALRNVHRMMRPGGTFRLVVPDLEARARQYVEHLGVGRTDANDVFLRSTLLGVESRPASLLARLFRRAGNSVHLWMWDFPSLEAALKDAEFVGVRRCKMGDSKDPMYSLVEREDRFHDADSGRDELAIEASRANVDPVHSCAGIVRPLEG